MNRRNYLRAMAVALPAAALPAAEKPPIQLHCDLELIPAREKQMLETYHKVFKPAISKQPGFVSVRLLKLTAEKQGKAPAGCPYRLVISFQTEEQRLTWVATPLHQKAWGAMEETLKGIKFTALLYDPVD
ncbi:MAG: antibiotic biosynthesis monooxygenase [Bryobacteraceae bacterium]